VSEVLVHASVAIAQAYGHLTGGEKQEATEAITDVIFTNQQQPDGLEPPATTQTDRRAL
jgi:hypothetical protein